MKKILQYIKKIVVKIYHWAFPVHELFRNQKNTISALIQKYNTIDYTKTVAVEDSMGEYTRGLLSLLMESKTFNFIFLTYLKNLIYPGVQEVIESGMYIQKELLAYLISTTKATAFGKQHHFELFDQEELYTAFVREVPIVIYDQFKVWIDRAKTESDCIWPGKISKFSASAGTTSRKKHIPVTDESLESMNKAGIDMFATYATKYPDTQAFSGYAWPLGGSIQEQLEDGSIIGDVSALLILERSRMFQKKYKYPLEVLLEPNRYTKRDLFLKQLDAQESTIMLGVTSWISEMLQYVKQKDPKKFSNYIKHLDLIVWGGVSAKPYIKQFNELGLSHIGVYNASEGYFGYQDVVNYANDQAQAPYQLLINHGIFYEFVPFTSQNFENGQLKNDAQVKPLREITQEDIDQKTKFALVITTNAGLFRYLIGDVICFVDSQWRFEIVGRTKECINLKGEELMEDHVNVALQLFNKKHQSDFSSYTVGPDNDQNPQAHEWILEGMLPPKCSLVQCTKELDILLQEQNADYEAKRKNDILLKMPIIHIVEPGTFHAWIKSNNKTLGGQTKIPKLSSEKTIINQILSLLAHQK